MHKYCADMDPAAALAKTLAQLVHDAKNCFKAVVAQGFQYMIGDFFDENLIQPCVEIVRPIEDAIPEAFKVGSEIVAHSLSLRWCGIMLF